VLVIYGVTEALGAYGLLAVFAAGFTFRRYEYGHDIHRGVAGAGKLHPKTRLSPNLEL